MDRIDIQSPKVFGGLKTDEYLALNPQGLIPMLVFPDGNSLWESDVSPHPLLPASASSSRSSNSNADAMCAIS